MGRIRAPPRVELRSCSRRFSGGAIADQRPSPAALGAGDQRDAAGHRSRDWPRGLDDPRFIYRRKLVPAASHPTLAAALARIAGVRSNDVIWDPFVGAGTELVERARLGPHKKLYGSDLDPAALAAARENLSFANLDAELVRGDARHYRPPEPVSLVLTNPPMGRRVRSHEGLPELFTVFWQHAAELLAVGGRLVWISAAAAVHAVCRAPSGADGRAQATRPYGRLHCRASAFRKNDSSGRSLGRKKARTALRVGA